MPHSTPPRSTPDRPGGPLEPRPRSYRFVDLPREVVREGLSRLAVRGDDSLVTVNWFEPGFTTRGPHSHPFDQLSFVFAGTLEFTVGGERFIQPAGSVLRIPAGVPHCAQPVGDEQVLNVDVFAPVREDFLYLTDYQNAEDRTETRTEKDAP
ncbi:cupin domain-containing protein [Streptomyces adelaidensis]|uniref:cupin domain-containing protein n=1 Tax=Streptomyces adelaidensis TaxID=2796465 RepID=UPI001908BB2A|nr:cupin domain-containing protein [Streptomyces adelaidensis]